MKATLSLILIAGLFIYTGCTRKAAVESGTMLKGTLDSVAIKYNQTVSVDAGNNSTINILFKKVKNDSRCPTGVQCVWAGTAFVQLQVNSLGDIIELELRKPKTIQLSNKSYVFELTALSPYPVYNSPTNADDYVATIKLTE